MIFWISLLMASLYGATMKIADLLDEHGLRWFSGDAIIFGLLWGASGAAIILMGDNEVSNTLLAMNIAFIFRMRIDYQNHAIAVCIIIISFLLWAEFQNLPFFLFLSNFMLFGSIKDYLGDKSGRTDGVQMVFELGWYYVIPTLIYSYYSENWLVFGVFTVYILFYDLVKYTFLTTSKGK